MGIYEQKQSFEGSGNLGKQQNNKHEKLIQLCVKTQGLSTVFGLNIIPISSTSNLGRVGRAGYFF